MTNKSINDKWLDAQSRPEKYTDEELDDMLFSQADLGLLKRALAYDEAKNEAMMKEKQSSLWKHPLMKIVAVFVGLLMLSGVSYAAYHAISRYIDNEDVAIEVDNVKIDNTVDKNTAANQDWMKAETTMKTPVVFEDAELSAILKYIADKTKVNVAYRNASAAHVRFYLQWDSKDSLQDIIDKINHFEKVHVSFDEANQLLIVE